MEFFREHEALLAELPDALRKIAQLRAGGQTYREIEAATGLAFNNVANYLAKARAAIAVLAGRGLAVLPPADVEGDVLNPPAVARARVRMKVIDGRVRAKTMPMPLRGRLPRAERALAELNAYPEDVERPATRGDCENMPRPCPFVSCAHHLYLDINPGTGSIKLNFPHLEPWEMGETCSLDVADRGGITLEEVGAILNLTRERIRQVEVSGLRKIKDHSADELGIGPTRGEGAQVHLYGPLRGRGHGPRG